MMSFTVVIPYRQAGDPARRHALDRIVREYAERFLFIDVVELDADEPWSKGAAVHRGVSRSDTPGVVVADADVLVAPAALARSLLAVTAGAPWSMPHSMVYRLTRRASMEVDAGVEPHLGMPCERAPHPAAKAGGIVVCSRTAYDLSGGLDPRFIGWGGEDISWARALDTLAGPGVHFDAPMFHLWHRPQVKRVGNRGSPENELLASRYLDAVGDPDAMREARWSDV